MAEFGQLLELRLALGALLLEELVLLFGLAGGALLFGDGVGAAGLLELGAVVLDHLVPRRGSLGVAVHARLDDVQKVAFVVEELDRLVVCAGDGGLAGVRADDVCDGDVIARLYERRARSLRVVTEASAEPLDEVRLALRLAGGVGGGGGFFVTSPEDDRSFLSFFSDLDAFSFFSFFAFFSDAMVDVGAVACQGGVLATGGGGANEDRHFATIPGAANVRRNSSEHFGVALVTVTWVEWIVASGDARYSPDPLPLRHP